MGRDIKNLLGKRVQAVRLAKDLKQDQLAESIDRSWQTISNLERGKNLPSLLTLMRVANALDLTLAELVEDVEAPPNPKRAQQEAQLRALIKQLPEPDLEIAIAQVEALLKRR